MRSSSRIVALDTETSGITTTSEVGVGVAVARMGIVGPMILDVGVFVAITPMIGVNVVAAGGGGGDDVAVAVFATVSVGDGDGAGEGVGVEAAGATTWISRRNTLLISSISAMALPESNSTIMNPRPACKLSAGVNTSYDSEIDSSGSSPVTELDASSIDSGTMNGSGEYRRRFVCAAAPIGPRLASVY